MSVLQLTTEKREERTERDFRYPICRSAIGQASCLIRARRRSRSVAKSVYFEISTRREQITGPQAGRHMLTTREVT